METLETGFGLRMLSGHSWSQVRMKLCGGFKTAKNALAWKAAGLDEGGPRLTGTTTSVFGAHADDSVRRRGTRPLVGISELEKSPPPPTCRRWSEPTSSRTTNRMPPVEAATNVWNTSSGTTADEVTDDRFARGCQARSATNLEETARAT